MKSREAQEQAIVVQWARMQENRFEELKWIFHCPNGGSRNKIEASNLKRQGVKAGVPDLLLLAPKNGYIGLAIEMKYGKNKCTLEQIKWLDWLHKQGYMCKVCYGSEEAIETIKQYLEIGD